MKTIIDKNTGKVLCSFVDGVQIYIAENEMVIDEILTETFENPHYDFETNTFYNLIENAN